MLLLVCSINAGHCAIRSIGNTGSSNIGLHFIYITSVNQLTYRWGLHPFIIDIGILYTKLGNSLTGYKEDICRYEQLQKLFEEMFDKYCGIYIG